MHGFRIPYIYHACMWNVNIVSSRLLHNIDTPHHECSASIVAQHAISSYPSRDRKSAVEFYLGVAPYPPND